MSGSRVVLVLLGLGILALVASVVFRPAPVPSPPPAPAASTVPSPATPPTTRPRVSLSGRDFPTDDRLGAIGLSPDEVAMLLAAGRGVQEAKEPSGLLSPEQKTVLAGIQTKLSAALCPPPAAADCRDVNLTRCFDRAGQIVAWRRKERDRVDRKLFTAAMGVSVTGREYPGYQNLVKFCEEMASLDPQK